ncbi:hypothetical protein MBLNU457_7147t1 [Dothideomycetes sp. NU457]
MSQSNDRDHFFQTSDSIASAQRKAAKSQNKNGSPIDLKSKILAVRADPDNANIVYVAQATGLLRRTNLETNDTKTTYTGAQAPLTSIAFSDDPPEQRTVYAGCWDKTIKSWSVSTRKPNPPLTGHRDFVKCLLWTRLDGNPILISGGADAMIIIRDLTINQILHTIKEHTRGILDIQLDPTSQPADEIHLFSADSAREIRRWRITVDKAEAISEPIKAHATSVNRLYFEPAGVSDDGAVDADLWTASSDKTVQHLVRSRGWESDTTLEHPDYVRDVVVSGDGSWVVTACRDEEVRVWDASSGKLACVYSGHFEEVTGLALVKEGREVVSVSIDGTVRRWSLDAAEIRKTREEAEKAGADGGVKEVPAEDSKTSMLTADEEAELAELMDSDDD